MFTEDTRTEKFLAHLGVKYRYTNSISFTEFDDDWDSVNLGRSQVKVHGAVNEYGTLMNRGSAAPAPILWRNPDTDNYEVLDGMQRLLAEEIQKPVSFSGYVIETDSETMVKKIRVFANYRLQGGYQESAEWTLERAVSLLVNSGSMSVEEVAELGGWSPSAVRDKKQVVDFRNAVCGVGGPERMTDSVLRIMAKHAAREDFASAPTSLAGFTNDIQRMRLSAAEAEPYIEDFFTVARSKGKLFDQFRDKLQQFRANDDVACRLVDPKRKRYQPMTAEGKLLKSLKGAQTTATRVLQSEEPVHDMAEYFQVLNQIKSALKQIERFSRRKK